jgi:hypothetical protein
VSIWKKNAFKVMPGNATAFGSQHNGKIMVYWLPGAKLRCACEYPQVKIIFAQVNDVKRTQCYKTVSGCKITDFRNNLIDVTIKKIKIFVGWAAGLKFLVVRQLSTKYYCQPPSGLHGQHAQKLLERANK